MNATLLVVEDLKRYRLNRLSIENMEDEIRELEEVVAPMKATDYERSSMPGGSGGDNAEERRRVEAMDRIAYLRPRLAYVRGKVRRMNRCMSYLTAAEASALSLVYIDRPADYHEGMLIERLGVERTQAYDTLRRAKNRFAEAMYGVVDG